MKTQMNREGSHVASECAATIAALKVPTLSEKPIPLLAPRRKTGRVVRLTASDLGHARDRRLRGTFEPFHAGGSPSDELVEVLVDRSAERADSEVGELRRRTCSGQEVPAEIVVKELIR